MQQLREERDRLTKAIDALGTGSSATTRPAKKRSGGITAAGRKRLSELMKKRWAAREEPKAKEPA